MPDEDGHVFAQLPIPAAGAIAADAPRPLAVGALTQLLRGGAGHAGPEIFHVRLGHRPDVLTIVPINGNCRTYDAKKESEASGCAIAALVPFSALQVMLAQRVHIRRIAEHVAVPVEVVHERIGATGLGYLMNAQLVQLSLAIGF